MRRLLVLLIFSIAVTLNAQTPCSGGLAGIYPCNDYDLLSSIDLNTLAGASGGSIIANDNWGWVDPLDGKEYAIMGTSTRTAFVDISDPLNPVFLGHLQRTSGSSANFWRDIKVYNNHAFIVADNAGAHGMQVFDLTNLRNVTNPPVTFTAVTTYTGVNSCHNIAINEGTGYAYLVGCGGVGNNGAIFIDLTDPANPIDVGGYNADGYTHDAQVITYAGPDIAYIGREIMVASNGVGGSSDDKIIFVNVSDKANPIKISEATYPLPGYAHQGWFTPDFRYFIVGDETDEPSIGNTRTLVFDVTDLDNPVLHTTYFGPTTSTDHNLYIIGDTLYEANYTSGMRVIDISDIDNSTTTTNTFTEVGYFDSFPANDNATTSNGAWNVYPFFPSGNIVISDQDAGMLIVRKSGTLSTPKFDRNSFSMYPNPASENVTIEVSQTKRINTISLSNLLGQTILSFDKLESSSFVIPTNTLAKGVYLVKVDNALAKKLVID
ncbi:choice-of-anchor B family protein [Sungkyunkwania multivorans]|uniref:Choice-of-anchor B family protein n=1 Tax=Sungkyunkwania multivorans TaxID=1173618 RepID=A0ABW3D0L2_9FLAO